MNCLNQSGKEGLNTTAGQDEMNVSERHVEEGTEAFKTLVMSGKAR